MTALALSVWVRLLRVHGLRRRRELRAVLSAVPRAELRSLRRSLGTALRALEARP